MRGTSTGHADNPTSAQIGAAIRELRVHRDLTIEELANAAGLDVSYLSGIERRLRNPSWESIRSIADALKIDVVELVRLAGTGESGQGQVSAETGETRGAVRPTGPEKGA
jgi:transcriptional regulator with XRE-family HTH domain